MKRWISHFREADWEGWVILLSSFPAFSVFLEVVFLQDWVGSRNTSGLYYMMAVLWQWKKMALKKKERRIKKKSLATTGQSNNYKNYLKIPRICNFFSMLAFFWCCWCWRSATEEIQLDFAKFRYLCETIPLLRLPPQQLLGFEHERDKSKKKW